MSVRNGPTHADQIINLERMVEERDDQVYALSEQVRRLQNMIIERLVAKTGCGTDSEGLRFYEGMTGLHQDDLGRLQSENLRSGPLL